MKSYEEAIEAVKEYALSNNGIMRAHLINNGIFAIVGHFIGIIYGVSDQQIIEDLKVKTNGHEQKLIEINK